MRRLPLALAAATGLGIWFTPHIARACGGCFAPPDTITTVNSHRMVVALGLEKSVLWDQIVYTGDPTDFAWVLPVPSPNVDVDVAEAAFFDDLDEATAPRVVADIDIPGCFGCCSAAAAPAPMGSEVTIHARETVGPYDVVVLGSDSSEALVEWLNENSYRIPESIEPVIASYTDRGSAFVAMRLAPGQGVSAMQPVRVTFEGFLSRFPLEMVTAGAAGELELALWVIAEQRYEAGNYANVEIDPDELTFDFETSETNYSDVFDGTIALAGGRAWVTEYAGPMPPLPNSDELASVGVVQSAPYVTRLRTRMLVDYLTEDLDLVPSEDSEDLGPQLIAGTVLNDPNGGGCHAKGRLGGAGGHVALIGGLCLAVLWMGWPRRRKTFG